VEPSGLEATFTVGDATVTGTALVTPTGVSSTFAVGTVTLVWTILPTGVQAQFNMGTVTVTGTAVVSPSGLAMEAAVGVPKLTIWNGVPDTGGGAWSVVDDSNTSTWIEVNTG
jgi:hypothetical protein